MLHDGQVGEKIEIVNDGGHVAADFRAGFLHLHTQHLDGTFIGPIGPDQAPQHRRLARAVAPGERDGLPRGHLEVEAFHNGRGPVGLLQFFNLENDVLLRHGDHCGASQPGTRAPRSGMRRS